MREYRLQVSMGFEGYRPFKSFGKMAHTYRERHYTSPSAIAYSVDVYRNERSIAEFFSQLKVSQLDKIRLQLTYLVRVPEGNPPSKIYNHCWMHGTDYYRKLKDQQIMVIAIHQIERENKVITKDKIESYFLRKQYSHTDCKGCPSCCVVVMEKDSCTLCKKYRKILVWGGNPHNKIQQPIECLKDRCGHSL